MKRRTKSRIIAMKILYAFDMTKDTIKACQKRYWDNDEDTGKEVRTFADFLVTGVSKNREDIDRTIADNATNWDLDRLAAIDRNIIRVASFEILYAEEVPPKAAINEAIDIAKRFGNSDSGRFVNGVLDKVLRNSEAEKQGAKG